MTEPSHREVVKIFVEETLLSPETVQDDQDVLADSWSVFSEQRESDFGPCVPLRWWAEYMNLCHLFSDHPSCLEL